MLRTGGITSSRCSLRTAEDFDRLAGDGVLGAVRYTTGAGPVGWEHGCPVLPLHMVRPGGPEVVEVWAASGPVRTGEHRGLHYAHDGEVLFAAGHIGPSAGCGEAAREAYLAAFELVDRLGYPHLFRMWNALEGITDRDGRGTEVYAEFCVGRARAFEESPRPMPAATGIGALGGGASFYFVAHRAGRVVHLENPLQVPAHEYPRRYGPRSPSFARATWLEGVLHVSGTASILDDATVCPGDVVRQCQVTLANLAALVGRDNLARHGLPGGWVLRDLRQVKVYVKRPEDVPTVTRLCREEFSRRAEFAVFAVDVCRPDLLVEIEGIAS
ncbi:FkbO/Hyg5 family chorismatase [Saccharothrix syringae]|uniref:Reactive intermediate/imine deaminase n=1 Tax=Saccharothrix syringae TaxID=103733 RepID=A0A5Q0H0K4_SACSY|nr:FkbO/Hyg5 family chorismatase [Saccharothrix syringae]QFZ19445.1 reactive intermediate/imine deaminase [Saccharothrix syringae]